MARAIDQDEVLYQLERLRLDAKLEDECEEEAIKRCIAAVKLVPTLTQPNEAEHAGLYGKYTVYKNKDGSLVTDCFILRPAKDPAAVTALRAYAAATDDAELAVDIINWVGAEPIEPLELEESRDMLTCGGCMYELDCPSPVHCQNCSRMGTDHNVYSREEQKDGKSR